MNKYFSSKKLILGSPDGQPYFRITSISKITSNSSGTQHGAVYPWYSKWYFLKKTNGETPDSLSLVPVTSETKLAVKAKVKLATGSTRKCT